MNTGSSVRATVEAAWRDLFELAVLPPDADFFNLGGDSLKATALAVNLEGIYGIAIDPAEVFEARRLDHYVQVIEALVRDRGGGVIEEGVL